MGVRWVGLDGETMQAEVVPAGMPHDGDPDPEDPYLCHALYLKPFGDDGAIVLGTKAELIRLGASISEQAARLPDDLPDGTARICEEERA